MTAPENLICLQTKRECDLDDVINSTPSQEISKNQLSDIGEVVTKNYGKYHELAAKHKGLQLWIKEQEKTINGK